ncbi:hypothetical protein HYALB_00007459 [Hymenoscyphus albidus]|uniref:Uncharacterized protein n=1 Tax=Hymenoscyphus albidus TaxID=595503 RepID=A0A9N9M582_9HELO|nr:hypothetical protein HYALB_00007459 [Hymenoscyphus albidus]
MKLIVTGATGFVGTEVLRQALRNPEITEIIALARKHVDPLQDSGDGTRKLRSVVHEDWTALYYPWIEEYGGVCEEAVQGRTEAQILDFAKENEGVEVTITKPAGIGGPGREGVNEAMRPVFAAFGDVPEVHVEVLVGVMLGVCGRGCERDTLWPRDLVGGEGGL